MAEIGWIDFSQSDREKVGTILDLLRPEGMVDELGIGMIRDAIANQLFPGISTIQTRAKYFFIVPYILLEYQNLSTQQRKKYTLAKYLEKRENEIMWDLSDAYNHQDGKGVIGISIPRNKPIMRRPSEIYWSGIAAYKLIHTSGLGIGSYLRRFGETQLESLLSGVKQSDEESGDDIDAEHEDRLGVRIPYVADWSKNLRLELTEEEADILHGGIVDNYPDKVIAELLRNKAFYKKFKSTSSFMDFAKIAVQAKNIPIHIKEILVLAHDFSEIAYGAHVAYNALLQNKKYKNNHYEKEWNIWVKKLKVNMLNYNSFNPEIIFRYPFATTAREFTKVFISKFWMYLKNGGISLDGIKELIITQELRNKGSKARLTYNKFDDVREKKWLGLERLEYRFNKVSVILNDIKQGLGGKL